jgi:hypothetical protein
MEVIELVQAVCPARQYAADREQGEKSESSVADTGSLSGKLKHEKKP